MTAAFPRRPQVEFFLGNDWRDFSADVRQNPGVTIVPGRKDEAARTPPCKCTFVLDDGPEHGNGKHNPENAAGTWYGELGRNTPVRVSLPYGADDFQRVSASGWGTSTQFGAWSSFQSAGTVASDVYLNSYGRHSITSTISFIGHYLPSLSLKNVDVSMIGNLQTAPTITGGNLEIGNLMVRGQSTSSYYLLRVEITTTQRLQVKLMQGDSTTLAGPVDAGPYNGLASALGFRLQADGSTLRGKVWQVSTGEPAGWNVEHSLASVSAALGAGWVGVRSGVAGGNSNAKPISFLYDNLTIRLPRFAGYTAKMVPTNTVDHANATVSVEAAGLLRIVRQGTATLGTPVRRYIDSGVVTLVDFWPLDDSPTAVNQGVNVAPNGARAVFRRDTSNALLPKGAIKWAAAEGLPSLGPALELTEGGYLTLPVQTDKLTGTRWAAAWMQKISADSGGSCWLRTQPSPGPGDVSFIWYTDGSYEVYLVGMPDVLLFSGSFTQYGFDDVWHSIKFSYQRLSATDVQCLLSVDSATPVGIVVAPVTYVPLLRFEAQAEYNSTYPACYAQVIVWDGTLNDTVADPTGTTGAVGPLLDRAYRGWRREPAAARWARLCAEEGVSYALVGDRAVSPTMGPQRDASLMDQLLECADVDQGSVFEPRGHPALGLVTTRALLDRADLGPVLSLDYSTKEVAPSFGPTRDDQGTVNDVMVKDLAGQQFHVEQTTGPLNVGDPGATPDGAGRLPKTFTVNVSSALLLPDQAGWRLHLGTVDEARFPTIAVDLAADAFAATARALAVLEVCVDDVIEVRNAQEARIYDPVRQVVRGWTEKLAVNMAPKITFNTTPASPYDTAILDNAGSRLDSDSSTLTNQFVAGVSTTMSVFTTGPRWTVDAADFPFNVRVGGVLVTVTGITGSSAPFGITQTFSVAVTPVNGITKTVPIGTAVSLARPVYLAP